MTNPPIAPLGIAVITIDSIFLLCAYVAVALRIYAVFLTQRPYRVHDYLIFVALFLASGHVVIQYLAIIVGGMGNHLQDIPTPSLTRLLKLFVADNFSWLFTTTSVKLSALCLYLDIFKVSLGFRRVTYSFITWVVCFFVGFLISFIFICQPFSHFWNQSGPGFCGSWTDSQILTSSINIIVDLSIVLLPVFPVWKLQMKRSKKLKVSAIFGVGGVICLINITRLICVVTLNQADFSYTLAPSAILTALEIELGVTCACLPTINPIFRRNKDLKFRTGNWELRSVWYSRSKIQSTSKRRMLSSLRGTEGSMENESNIRVTQDFGVISGSNKSGISSSS